MYFLLSSYFPFVIPIAIRDGYVFFLLDFLFQMKTSYLFFLVLNIFSSVFYKLSGYN
jgi:hypothetical protein